ncbi:MAG: transcriptional regulator, partial [Egibacteraceae bacterium]
QIGRVRAKAGQPDGACEALLTGLDLAEPVGYTMGVERARGVRARFPKRWTRLSCVRKLDERLGLR